MNQLIYETRLVTKLMIEQGVSLDQIRMLKNILEPKDFINHYRESYMSKKEPRKTYSFKIKADLIDEARRKDINIRQELENKLKELIDRKPCPTCGK